MADKRKFSSDTLLVLVFDPKTGKVSTNGGPFRKFRFAAAKQPYKPGEPSPKKPSEPEDPGDPGPFDEFVCAKLAGEPESSCRRFFKSGDVFYDTGRRCTPPCEDL